MTKENQKIWKKEGLEGVIEAERDKDQDFDDEVDQKIFEGNHHEQTKIKNIETIHFGLYSLQAWYWSPFHPDFCENQETYMCEFCLKYFKNYK